MGQKRGKEEKEMEEEEEEEEEVEEEEEEEEEKEEAEEILPCVQYAQKGHVINCICVYIFVCICWHIASQ